MSSIDKIIRKIKIMLFGVRCQYRACGFCEEPNNKCTYKELEDVKPNSDCAHFVDKTK